MSWGSQEGILDHRTLITASLLTALIAFCAGSADARAVRSLRDIRQHDVVMQKWDNSCGAAALATVLTYGLGEDVSEEAAATGMLRRTEPLKVRYRGGFSLLDMKRFVEGRGLRGQGYRQLGFQDLGRFENPIVSITLHGYSHFVVFRGLDGDGEVTLADPAFGNRTMSVERFNEVWSNGMAFVVTRRTT
jgi:predicted double-glycine peptidase